MFIDSCYFVLWAGGNCEHSSIKCVSNTVRGEKWAFVCWQRAREEAVGSRQQAWAAGMRSCNDLRELSQHSRGLCEIAWQVEPLLCL